ncbi:MAG: class I SAM-dependent methyltransferase [Promethearchaeota archaeon]
MEPELQAFAIEFTNKILPEIEGIVETYEKNAEEGFSAYFSFIKRVKPSVEKIVKGFSDHISIGRISPRLLRDPLSIEFIANKNSFDEKEAHIVGYLKAILQLVYCGAKGLEGWQFSGTSLYEESIKTQTVGKINIIPSLVQIVRQEIDEADSFEKLKTVVKKNKNLKEKKLRAVKKTQAQSQNLEDKNTSIAFTARLIAYYRAQEFKSDSPLIVDPFAERLAGNLTSYINEHKHFSKNDYAIVRSYYIEENLLTPWCNTHEKSQIVLLGSGLDTRAYRFKPLQTNIHTIFEIDFSMINRYKEEILQDEQPLCDLVRISGDVSNQDWIAHLMKSGFSNDTPTFWILEGLVYYMEQEVVASLLKKTAEICAENSQIFVDLCVPILAELNFGPFSRYFKWGLEIDVVPSFFATSGWNVVSCSFADDYDQGRDVGQRGFIFVHGGRINFV